MAVRPRKKNSEEMELGEENKMQENSAEKKDSVQGYTRSTGSYQREYSSNGTRTQRPRIHAQRTYSSDKSAQGGDAACLTALKAANAGGKNINERLDGQTHDLSLAGLKAGYVYELAYSALDYHGKIATRKFYLTVQ